MKTALKTAPAVDRLEAKADPKAKARVDREGGRYGAGVIFAVSLCSIGEALGHRMWIDEVMLQQIVDLSPAGPTKFLKSRFTHPDMCSDGMGKALGTIEETKLVGDQVYGDLHFYSAAHIAPDGDLAGYVMSLAEEDPANFGTSIVFAHDLDAEEEFLDQNTKVLELKDDEGNVVDTRKQFQSPDPNNVQNYRHARIAEMRAADVVDEPGANPNGLFHRESELLNDGGKLIDFVLGRSTEAPALSSSLGVAPERLKSFVSKYLANAGISLSKKEDAMADAKTKSKLAEEKPVDDPKEKKDAPADDKPADKKEPDETKAEDDPAKDDEDDSASKESKCGKPDATLPEYCAAFGNADGAQFFMDGISFKSAQAKHIASLKADLKERDDKLAAFAKLGVDPVGFSAAKDEKRDESNKSALGNTQEPVDNRSLFAKLNTAVAVNTVETKDVKN